MGPLRNENSRYCEIASQTGEERIRGVGRNKSTNNLSS
jgi:hypothetical protein